MEQMDGIDDFIEDFQDSQDEPMIMDSSDEDYDGDDSDDEELEDDDHSKHEIR